MSHREFQGKAIEVIDFDDAVAGERVIEFRNPGDWGEISIVAVVLSEGDSWDRARVSINPDVGEVSVGFMQWAISVSQELLG